MPHHSDAQANAETVPHIVFERRLEAGRALPRLKKGETFLVDDEDRGTILDLVGIDGISAKDLDVLRVQRRRDREHEDRRGAEWGHVHVQPLTNQN